MRSQEFQESSLARKVLTTTGESAALVGVVFVAFLGKAAVKPALAMAEAKTPSAPEQIEAKPRIIAAPEGVPVINTDEAIYKEAQAAFSKIKMRENGTLTLHKPTKRAALVSFTQSPTAYTRDVGPDFSPDSKGAFRVTQYLTVRFKTKAGFRDYAVTFNNDPAMGEQGYWFLDLDYAEEMGAVDFGKLKGEKEKSPFNIAKDYRLLPKNEIWRTMPPHEVFTHTWDIHGQLRQVLPSKQVNP